MSLRNFSRVLRPNLERAADLIKVQVSERATNKYMRDSGAKTPQAQKELGPNRKTGPGSLRIVTGRLARSLIGSRSAAVGMNTEGYTKLDITERSFNLTIGTDVPYADYHEYGFSGTVQVPSHKRKITQAFGRALDSPQVVSVKAYSRAVSIPARPYLQPAKEASMDKVAEILAETIRRSVIQAWQT